MDLGSSGLLPCLEEKSAKPTGCCAFPPTVVAALLLHSAELL